MPIENAFIDCPQNQSPYQTLGKIITPVQDAFSPARRVFADYILSFSPFLFLPELLPLSSINRVRIKAYAPSTNHRHITNAQPRVELTDISQFPD